MKLKTKEAVFGVFLYFALDRLVYLLSYVTVTPYLNLPKDKGEFYKKMGELLILLTLIICI